MSDPGIMAAFERLYGKELADQVRGLIAKRDKGAIDSVGRDRSAGVIQRQKGSPPDNLDEAWWNK